MMGILGASDRPGTIPLLNEDKISIVLSKLSDTYK